MDTKITFLITILASIVIIECGEFYVVNGTKYFISYPVTYNWYQAQRYCTYYNMYLVSIHSFEEHQEVTEVIKKFMVKNSIPTKQGLHFYTSGTDAGHNVNDYYWATTGLPTIFKNWINSEIPDNASNNFNSTDDCLVLNGDHDHRWNDINCYDKHNLICQDKLGVMGKLFSINERILI